MYSSISNLNLELREMRRQKVNHAMRSLDIRFHSCTFDIRSCFHGRGVVRFSHACNE